MMVLRLIPKVAVGYFCDVVIQLVLTLTCNQTLFKLNVAVSVAMITTGFKGVANIGVSMTKRGKTLLVSELPTMCLFW